MASNWRLKNRKMVAMGQVILVMAACVMAAVGFAYIIDTLTARTVGFQRAFGLRATVTVPPGR